jgi:hypothetical protein
MQQLIWEASSATSYIEKCETGCRHLNCVGRFLETHSVVSIRLLPVQVLTCDRGGRIDFCLELSFIVSSKLHICEQSVPSFTSK